MKSEQSIRSMIGMERGKPVGASHSTSGRLSNDPIRLALHTWSMSSMEKNRQARRSSWCHWKAVSLTRIQMANATFRCGTYGAGISNSKRSRKAPTPARATNAASVAACTSCGLRRVPDDGWWWCGSMTMGPPVRRGNSYGVRVRRRRARVHSAPATRHRQPRTLAVRGDG